MRCDGGDQDSRNFWVDKRATSRQLKKSQLDVQMTDDFIRTEYAVDPVGVEIVRPSPCTVVMWCSSPEQVSAVVVTQNISGSPNSSSILTYGLGPRSITRSFSTSKDSTGRVVKHMISLSFPQRPLVAI